MKRGADDLPVVEDLLDEIASSTNHSPQSIGMAAEKLGGAMNDKICAQFKRPLVYRRGKGVVHHYESARIVPRTGKPSQVDDFHGGVGRRL